MRLYYVPHSRSVRPRWLLEELGVPYELVRLNPMKQENRQPDYLNLHPLGHVPTLVDQDLTLIESAAICMYLADKYPEKKLAPPVGTKERAEYYQWIMFGMATLEPPLITIFFHAHFLPEGTRNPALVPDALARAKEVLQVVDKRMSDRQYIVGDSFTAADVVVGSIAGWAKSMGQLEGFSNLGKYVQTLAERPANRRSRAD